MKTKVIIENGEITINLTPENEFESGVIEKVYRNKEKHNVDTCFNAKYEYGTYKNHKIELSIKEL